MDRIEDKEKCIGKMQKRCVMMADGKRYLIYYTFEDLEPKAAVGDLTVERKEENENV